MKSITELLKMHGGFATVQIKFWYFPNTEIQMEYHYGWKNGMKHDGENFTSLTALKQFIEARLNDTPEEAEAQLEQELGNNGEQEQPFIIETQKELADCENGNETVFDSRPIKNPEHLKHAAGSSARHDDRFLNFNGKE